MEQTERILNFFYANRGVFLQVSEEEVHDIVNIVTIVLDEEEYSEELKKKSFELLCDIASVEKLSLEERWVIYWNLVSKIFVNTKYDAYSNNLREVYASIYKDIEKLMPQELLGKSVDRNADGPVVIVTSQFLSEGHAPTRRVLDYAYTIQTKLGVNVKIINDSGMNFRGVSYIKNGTGFNYISEYEKKNKYFYKGITFDFFQNPNKMPDLQGIANLIYNIKQLNPRLVLNVGANCLTSDLCRQFAKTATIPCSTNIPTSMAENLILCREIREEDKQQLEKLYPWQNVVESVFNYILQRDKEMCFYSREMFAIPEDAWLLASAGNRMQAEMDADFLHMIDELLGELEECHFLIIGQIENKEKILSGLKNIKKIHFAGQVKDGSQAIRLADVYIQPTRKGGGRAAFEALYHGVPVITTKYGDTWDVCGSEFEVDSYEKMKEQIKKYYSQKEIYEMAVKNSTKRATILEDMQGMFEKLFADLQVENNKGSRIDKLKFYNIFQDVNTEDDDFKKDIDFIKNRVYTVERQARENEWAQIFHDTLRGSEWLKDVSLSPGRCALGYAGIYALYRILEEFQPKKILEMGLGQSTKIIGSYAAKKEVKHSIVEHDESWIDFFWTKNKKTENTRMVHLERKEEIYHGRWVNTNTPIKFYKDFKESFGNEKFDFIFVDGPQGSKEYSRVDVTEILPECLEKSFVIMIDDSGRQGEYRTISMIVNILKKSNIEVCMATYDGLKNTTIIVSKDLAFLCSL